MWFTMNGSRPRLKQKKLKFNCRRKKMRMLLIVLVILTLLILSIRTLAQTTPQAIILQKNNPTPYQGVLMPMSYARELEKKSLDLKFCEIEMQKHEGDAPLYTAPDGGKTVLIGLGGVLLGFIIGFSTK